MIPRPPARKVPSRTLKKLAGRLRSDLRRVRKDPADAGAVHDARVSARRLLAAGAIHAENSPEWEELRERLPKFVRRLGRVRNLDVAIDFLRKGKTSDRDARRALAKVLRRRRKRAHARLEKWLDRRRLRRLDENLKGALREIRQTGRFRAAVPHDLSPFFGRILTLYSDRAWSTDTEAAHEVRREVRLLRYAHETLDWAYPPEEFERAGNQLQKVQRFAGSWHDRTMVEELAEKAARKGEVTVSLEPLLVRLRAEGRAYIRKFVKATSELIHMRQEIEGIGR